MSNPNDWRPHDIDRKNTLRLIQCPHCDGRPTGVVWMEYFLDMGAWPTARITCGECNATMDTHGMSRDDAIEKAIAKWNRRAQPENEPLTLDEMNALDHEPIYVLHTGGKWTMNGWHTVKHGLPTAPNRRRTHDEVWR